MTTNIVYQAKLPMMDGLQAPDSWDMSLGLEPPTNFVVARHRDGSVASLYGDMSWNRTPYKLGGRSSWLHFQYWAHGESAPQREYLAGEMRYIMFILIWKKEGKPHSNATLDGYLISIRRLAQFAEQRGCHIRDILTKKDLFVEYVAGDVPGGLLVYLRSLLLILLSLGPEQVGFRVLGSEADVVLQPLIASYRGNARQYSPLPTRIYSLTITAMRAELDEWEEVADRYLAMVKDCLNDPLLGKHPSVQGALARKRSIRRVRGEYKPGFVDLLRQYRRLSIDLSRDLKLLSLNLPTESVLD